jgi:alpha-tubulin suppressor-like RCC1 family protein
MVSGALNVALSTDGILVLLDNGTVTAVGFTDPLPLPDSVRGAQVKAISGCHSGDYMLAILKESGRVVAWESNPNKAARVAVPDAAQSGVSAIDCGDRNALALLVNGSVIQWDLRANTEDLGWWESLAQSLAHMAEVLLRARTAEAVNGTANDGGQLVEVGKVLQIAAGWNYSLALVQDRKNPNALPRKCCVNRAHIKHSSKSSFAREVTVALTCMFCHVKHARCVKSYGGLAGPSRRKLPRKVIASAVCYLSLFFDACPGL